MRRKAMVSLELTGFGQTHPLGHTFVGLEFIGH
jgi:hypothetical protein